MPRGQHDHNLIFAEYKQRIINRSIKYIAIWFCSICGEIIEQELHKIK